ncbi:MAG: DMT family transporter [Xanthobacteraceae bacterium]
MTAVEHSSSGPIETGRNDQVVRGIALMIGATVMFAVSNALSKWLVAAYPVGEVMFGRSLSSFVICSALMLPTTGFSVFATQRVRAHLARGASQAISQTFTVLAFSMMPLGGAVAINFSAPLFSGLVSVLWLKERAGAARWGTLLAGFAGVLVVVRPGADSFQLGALFALANAVMYGSVTVAVRGMSKTESANTLLMWQMVTLAVMHAGLLVFGVRCPSVADAILFVAMGFANAAAQYLWTKALHAAPATAVSPFYYFLLVWSLFIGFLVWGEVPTASLLVGSGIVVASGLFLLYSEAHRAAASPASRGSATARSASTDPEFRYGERQVGIPLPRE